MTARRAKRRGLTGRVARAVLATLAVAGGWLVVPVAPPAAAQQSGSVLRLASQTPWVGAGEEFVLRLDVTTSEAPADVELAVAVYRRVTSRSEFTRTLDDGPRGNPVTGVPPTKLADLAVDAAGAVLVRLPTQDPAQPLDPARLRLTADGVYPVRVELRETGGGKSLAGLVTHLVYTRPPQPGGYPLGVALVLPVHAPPTLRPDGTRALPERTASGLAALARSLEAYPSVALTLLPTPETLLTLDTSERPEDRETVATLARAVAGRQVAAGTFVPVSLSSFAGSGMASEVAIQLDRGSQVIEQTLGTRPDPRTWAGEDGLDERAALLLRQQQVDRLVLPERAFEPAKLPITLTQPFAVDARAVRRPAALAADGGLVDHFSPADDPVLAAHRLLADLAVVYQDQPSRRRAVVVAPPRSWSPDKAFLDSLLSGLSSSPILTGTTADDAFASVPPATTATGAPLVRRLAPAPAPQVLPANAIAAARRQLVGFASMLAPENALDDRMEQLLLLAEGAGLRSDRRADFLRGLDERIRSQAASVLVPSHRSITLTARTGEIPVTVLSKTGYPLKVQIKVASDKLDFPNGSVRDVDLLRRSTTERFSVRARTSGSFPLRVSLVSPDGGLELGTSRFTVRSTAASGVGVVLSGGAILFLFVWWARHLVRGRRNRRLVPA
ncbi:MAG TPA: DUF6049 family protein [Acidimicrobiales bacterium]|nr:DUF6049 family protein [Acidimicrobiales bacterium]